MMGLEDAEWLLCAIADQAAVCLEKLRPNQAAVAAQKAQREREEQFQGLYDSPLIGLVLARNSRQALALGLPLPPCPSSLRSGAQLSGGLLFSC